jgi:hypothetical protein
MLCSNKPSLKCELPREANFKELLGTRQGTLAADASRAQKVDMAPSSPGGMGVPLSSSARKLHDLTEAGLLTTRQRRMAYYQANVASLRQRFTY